MNTMDYQSLPVINYQTLHEPATLRALDCACRSWGAFVLAGHPLDDQHTRRLLTEAKSFFARPEAYKKQVLRTLENPCGYYDAELTKNTPDNKEIYDYSPAEVPSGQMRWPEGMTEFETAVKQHYFICESMALTLMVAICQNLGASTQDLMVHFQPRHTSFLRLNHYPTSASRGDEGKVIPLGVHPHTDSGVLTLLLQDSLSGLEILRDGRWYRVRGSNLVVNIGDIVQVWSNDRYRAPLHRVAASTNEARMSAPFFFNPAFDTTYSPLAATVDSDHPPAYGPINWGEFRRLRATGDYADYGEEVQIQNYRLRD